MTRIKFKLANVNDFAVSGIKVNDKNSLSDFSPADLLKLTVDVAAGKLPVSFNVNVLAKNPNDGTGGFPATDIKIKSFPWTLSLNDKETISGNITEPITVPGVGEETSIALQMNLDLFKFFEDKGFNDIMDMILKLGGQNSSTSSVKIIADPVLDTPIGDMKYPEQIVIIDSEFK